ADGSWLRAAIAWVAAAAVLLAATRPKPLGRGVLLFLAGALAPWLLVWWAPKIGGVSAQSASLILRFLAAFVLANWAYVKWRELMLGRSRWA
ncbi:MAG: hypothetical protein ACRD44_03710, partial [Bryobacteraceae bacterium]